MRRGLKKRVEHIKIIFLYALFTSFNVHPQQININFDVLFPMTWYQKSLAVTIGLWHTMRQLAENNQAHIVLQSSFSLLLGHFSLGQFYIERMMVKEAQTADEDKMYLFRIIEDVIGITRVTFGAPELSEHLNYMLAILKKMQKILKSTTKPILYQDHRCHQ